MRLELPLDGDLRLEIGDETGAGDYPTARVRKGLLLADGATRLEEEGVGFGVPVLKRGRQTIFPGGLGLSPLRTGDDWAVSATFTLDLVERLSAASGGILESPRLYAVKDALAAVYRRAPSLRRPLGAVSSGLRGLFGWETAYVETEPAGVVTVLATAGAAGQVHVALDLDGLHRDGLTEVIVMNEQGARPFDGYRDSDGAARSGAAIGAWQQVQAAEACFACSARGISFCLGQTPPARLYRGRELVGSRLSWAGFAYVLPPEARRFEYDIAVGRAR